MTKPIPTIADVIHLAIEEYLREGNEPKRYGTGCFFSCDALRTSCYVLGVDFYNVKAFLESLGCNMRSALEFDEFQQGHQRQYARALSLTFAEMIAREEGV
jgi:hypothetical protein